MSYTLITDGNTVSHQIKALAETEHISREAAALKLIEAAATSGPSAASPEARRILGAFSSP